MTKIKTLAQPEHNHDKLEVEGYESAEPSVIRIDNIDNVGATVIQTGLTFKSSDEELDDRDPTHKRNKRRQSRMALPTLIILNAGYVPTNQTNMIQSDHPWLLLPLLLFRIEEICHYETVAWVSLIM